MVREGEKEIEQREPQCPGLRRDCRRIQGPAKRPEWLGLEGVPGGGPEHGGLEGSDEDLGVELKPPEALNSREMLFDSGCV